MTRGKRLSDGERAMIVNAYNFFLKGRQEYNKVSGRTRELVHQCLGTPTSTIGASLYAPPFKYRRAMSCLLRRLGYRYIKGESRHYMADSVQNVAYRGSYLRQKFADVEYDEKHVKPQLLELVRTHKPAPFYVAIAIATMYHHRVYYTPPYHPELQPIELIWGNMKGWIGRHPAKTIVELEEKVDLSKEHITSKDWKNAYKSIQKEEDKYLQTLERHEVECADADDESELSDSQDEYP
ncbi:hypothetical protein PHPALM_4038 [Phytophthora palmivora]|uniref:Tc1-like transposase DDE domain-containing protein n=1 Tax=Phytophthora palmivora TaxID=4796 RepID=A0A2P4YL11_9STRA|nr:hypothetical protein PHPALM_4038 [Phytophthora palmivora]